MSNGAVDCGVGPAGAAACPPRCWAATGAFVNQIAPIAIINNNTEKSRKTRMLVFIGLPSKRRRYLPPETKFNPDGAFCPFQFFSSVYTVWMN